MSRLANNEMKPTSRGQDGGSRLISVFGGRHYTSVELEI
jgi:hypothetical protein